MLPIRVHITDDLAVVRCGLCAFIERQPGMEVVSEAWDVETTISSTRLLQPQVAIVDINQPGSLAVQIARQLLSESPRLGLIMLTIHEEELYLRESLRLGVRGYMVKTSSGEALLEAIRRVHRGEDYVDPVLAHYLIDRYVGRGKNCALSLEQLTAREREICGYLISGYTNAQVADCLNISKRTVESHRASIMAKTGAKNRAELVQLASDYGIARNV